MSADPAPDDVRLARVNLVAVLERGPPVRRPAHLPDARVSLHPLDAEAGMETLPAFRQIGDEDRYGLTEGPLLLRRESIPVAPERRRTLRVGIERLGALVQRG